MFEPLFRNRTLYLINFCFLLLLQIDSAYWKEWNLYNLPGGETVYLGINNVMIVLAFIGLFYIFEHHRMGLKYAVGMSGFGLFVVLSHAYFLLTGASEFRTFISIALMSITLFISISQGYLAVRTMLFPKRHNRSDSVEEVPVH